MTTAKKLASLRRAVMKRIKQSYHSLKRLKWQDIRTLSPKAKLRIGGIAAVVLLVGVGAASLIVSFTNQRYELSDATLKLVGENNKALSDKLTYNSKEKRYEFNKEALRGFNPEEPQQKQVGGADDKTEPLYALDVPTNPKKGVTYHDVNSQLSFKLIPQFGGLPGKTKEGRVVFPLDKGQQAVYTLKNNGLKEDIIISDNSEDTLEFSYNFELPKTLEARLLPDKSGGIGIYSADPLLYTEMSYSSDKDRELVEKARETGEKTFLVFGIPAPVITTKQGDEGSAHAQFKLEDNKLTVIAENLRSIEETFSIDPSVVVTSTADFSNSNNEGNIDFGTNQISRGGLTGATVSDGWSSAGAGLLATQQHLYSVVSDNTIYIMATATDKIYYGPLNNGNISSLTVARNASNTADTSPKPNASQTGGWSYAVYNGYIYEFGAHTGTAGSRAPVQSEYYAKITPTGNVEGWTQLQASSPWGPRDSVSSVIYDGYAYVVGGVVSRNGLNNGNVSSNGATNTTYKARVNADGTLGTWVLTGTPNAAMTTERWLMGITAYNGYIYIASGCLRGTNITGANCEINGPSAIPSGQISNDVSRVAIGADGALGIWESVSSTIIGRAGANTLSAHNGYLYALPGCTGQNCQTSPVNDTEYAPIHADGSIGTWKTTSMTSNSGGAPARLNQAVFMHQGHIYQVGGCTNTTGVCSSGTWLSDSISAEIDPAGVTGSYNAAADYTTPDGRLNFATASHNGYIYIIGGTTSNSGGGGTMLNTTRYARINSDGTLTWNTASTNFLNTSSSGACSGGCSGRIDLTAGVHNGYLYIAGGTTNVAGFYYWSDVQSALICTGTNTGGGCTGASTPGDLGTWSDVTRDFVANSPTTHSTANGRLGLTMNIYNGTMYLMGGQNDNPGLNTFYDDIYYATLTATGGAGAFNPTIDLPSTGTYFSSFVHDSKFYVVGLNGDGTWDEGSSDTGAVHFTTINSDGSLSNTCPSGYTCSIGNWVDANAVANGGSGSDFAPTELNNYGVNIWNGYLYISGGHRGFGASNTLNTVSRAKLNQNGSLGSWQTTQSFTTPRWGQASVAANGHLYQIGGCENANVLGTASCNSTTAIRKDYQYAPINHGGSGQTGSWTASAFNGSAAIGGYASSDNYVYSIRGCGGGIGNGDLNCDNGGAGTQGMVYTSVNSDGSFASWQNLSATGTPPPSSYGLSAVAYDGYLYVVGGCTNYAASTCSAISKQVYYAPINSNGNVGTWATAADFDASTGRYGHTLAAHNGYLYIVGGCTATSAGSCTAYENTILMAEIGSSGAPGAWSSAGSNFSGARVWQSAMVYNSRLYVIGGCTAMVTENCTGQRDDIQMVGLNSNGTLNGSWENTRSFITPRSAFGAVAYNGYLYIAGGCARFNTTGGNCSDYKDDVLYAPISPNGHIGTWNKSATAMTSGVTGHGLVVANGRLVSLFGVSATHSYQGVARSSPIQVVNRVGRYSKLIDFGRHVNIREITANHTLPFDKLGITYKAAGSDQLFDISGESSEITGVDACTGPLEQTRYLQVTLVPDDSQSGTFPDETPGTVTDFTVRYNFSHPPPNIRLRLGQTLQNGELSPYDTCGNLPA